MKNREFKSRWHLADREEIREWQAMAVRRFLINQVRPFSRHYREMFLKHGVEPEEIQSLDDLAWLPFTSKRHLVSNAEGVSPSRDFVLIPDEKVLARRPATIGKALVRGKAAVKSSFEREYRPLMMTSTTGRSAEQVPFLYTRHDLDNLVITGRRMMEICESEREFRHMNLFPYAPHLAFWQAHYAGLGFNTFMLSSGGGKVMGTEGNVRMLGKVKPDALIGMPTFIYHVLQVAVEQGLDCPNLRKIVLGGEKVPGGMRRKLRSLSAELGAGRVDVMATYGFTEAKMAWPECPGSADQPAGYHLAPDLGIVEIVDPESGRVLPDGVAGEIVFTPLDSRGSVVLRYRTGDHISGGLVYGPCPGCGRTMPRLVGDISRVSDVRRMNIGKVKGTLVNFNDLEHILDDLDEIGTWQIELRKRNDDPLDVDEIVVHVAPRGRVSRDRLTTDVEARFMEATEVRPNRVEFHDAETLRRLHGVGKALKEEKVVDHREVSTTGGEKPELTPMN